MACELVTSATAVTQNRRCGCGERRSENLINQMKCVDLKKLEGCPRILSSHRFKAHTAPTMTVRHITYAIILLAWWQVGLVKKNAAAAAKV